MLEFKMYKCKEDCNFVIVQESDDKYVAAMNSEVLELTDEVDKAMKFNDEEVSWGIAYELHYKMNEWYRVIHLHSCFLFEFFVRSKWAVGYAEVRRYVDNNSVKVNGIVIHDSSMVLNRGDIVEFGKYHKGVVE